MNRSRVLSVMISVAILFAFANFQSITAQTVEDQYWDAVKNSTRIADFESYLKEYPNGKYAALALQKLGRSPGKPNVPGPSSRPTDVEVLNRWVADIKPRLPEEFGGYILFGAESRCPAGCDFQLNPGLSPSLALDYIIPFKSNVRNADTYDIQRTITPRLLDRYCSTEGMRRNISLNISLWYSERDESDFIGNFFVYPKDCYQKPSTKSSSGTQTDTQFLNKWAAEVRVGLPELVGGFQLTDGRSVCPAGCEKSEGNSHLWMSFATPNRTSQQITIKQAEQGLKPALLQVYCESEGRQRNLMLGIYIQGMYNRTIGNFWVYPTDCPAKAISNPAPTQSNIQYLNNWAKEVRVDLPEMIGNYKLTDARSNCASGCDEQIVSGGQYLALSFDVPDGLESAPIGQIEASLKPTLMEVYCQTEAVQRNINLLASFGNRVRNVSSGFFVYPSDCK